MKRVVILLALGLAGCANMEHQADQLEAIKLHYAAQKPLIRIEALPGQQITGLASIEINVPQPAPIISPPQPHPAWQTLNNLLPFVATVFTMRESSKVMIGVAGVLNRALSDTTTNTKTITRSGDTVTTNTNTNTNTTNSNNPATTTSTTSSSNNPVSTTGSYNPSTSTVTSTANPSTTTNTTSTSSSSSSATPGKVCSVSAAGVLTCF